MDKTGQTCKFWRKSSFLQATYNIKTDKQILSSTFLVSVGRGRLFLFFRFSLVPSLKKRTSPKVHVLSYFVQVKSVLLISCVVLDFFFFVRLLAVNSVFFSLLCFLLVNIYSLILVPLTYSAFFVYELGVSLDPFEPRNLSIQNAVYLKHLLLPLSPSPPPPLSITVEPLMNAGPPAEGPTVF